MDRSRRNPSAAWHLVPSEKAGKVPVMASRPNQEELVSRLMELFARTLDHQGTCLETLELTYAQAKLIWRLEASDTPSLKEAARRCGVDPSNLSSVVDQLTERGLMTSRPATHDKRVRIVRLTGEGVRMRRRLLACLSQNPSLGSLSSLQQKQLLEILREVA
jgi:DNA-binding MarR family transcriptional regulator